MTSYSDQITATIGAHVAVNALEAQARQQVLNLLSQYESALIDYQAFRVRIEGLVRATYRSAGLMGSNLVATQSGLEDWTPKDVVFTSLFLNALIQDVRRNLKAFKASEKDDVARRRMISRVNASIGVGTQRGYTDAQLKGYTELQDLGYEVHKVWWANFTDHTPCDLCAALHGTEVQLDQQFSQGVGATKVYHSLEGPPRHPNCHCILVVLITTLDNAYESRDFEAPQQPVTELSTEQVQAMPNSFFLAAVGTLKKIVTKFRKSHA